MSSKSHLNLNKGKAYLKNVSLDINLAEGSKGWDPVWLTVIGELIWSETATKYPNFTTPASPKSVCRPGSEIETRGIVQERYRSEVPKLGIKVRVWYRGVL